MLFREIIIVYSENHTKPMNTLCGQNAELLIIKVGGTLSYHFKGLMIISEWNRALLKTVLSDTV
jgi:hypothetical protein